MASNRKLENLKIWNDSRVFVVAIYSMFKDNHDYGFKDQIQRAAVSIMNNIAEGFEYGSDAQFVRYLRIAKGSCSEVKSMLYLCSDLGYCSLDKREELQRNLDLITSGIYKLMEYLVKENKGWSHISFVSSPLTFWIGWWTYVFGLMSLDLIFKA